MSATCNPCPCPVSPSDVEDLEKQLPGYLKATVEWFRLYKDPTNLNGKVQKHQNFEQEIKANTSRIEELTNVGEALIESQHFAAERIAERLAEIQQLWSSLEAAARGKGAKLAEASEQQQFNGSLEDMDLWMSELEGQLMSELTTART